MMTARHLIDGARADPDALRRGIPVALAENGTVWRLCIRLHVLIVGVMGVGKASVLWAIIAGLVPFIRSGLVNLW
jgi:DNA segregation ATPase FtsK/SpoIIIE, S-DNA-T family